MSETDKRWRATIYYRTDNGIVDVEHFFEELEDLGEIVERGPNFGSIEEIVVTIRPLAGSETMTLEELEAQ